MESKYNLLTRLLKNIKNVVNPDGSIAGSGSGVLVVHETQHQGEVLLSGTLPNFSGYAWRTVTESNKEKYYINVAADLDDVDTDKMVVILSKNGLSIQIDNKDIKRLYYDTGVLYILIGWSGNSHGYSVLNTESDVTGAVMTVYTGVDTRLDKTYKEITDAGFCVLDRLFDGRHFIAPMISFEFDEANGGIVEFGTELAVLSYTCSTENDYPKLLDFISSIEKE